MSGSEEEERKHIGRGGKPSIFIRRGGKTSMLEGKQGGEDVKTETETLVVETERV